MMIALDPGVVCYRSVRNNANVRIVAEYFGGKGHKGAGTNPINNELFKFITLIILTKKRRFYPPLVLYVLYYLPKYLSRRPWNALPCLASSLAIS